MGSVKRRILTVNWQTTFCFVSTKGKKGKVEGLHFLRMGMMQLWAKWLQDER
jgi:hypothetical protein